MEEKELWMNKLKEKLADYSEPTPASGWEQLEKELMPPVEKKIYPYRKWMMAAAAVIILAVVSSVSLYFLGTPAADEIRHIQTPALASTPDALPGVQQPDMHDFTITSSTAYDHKWIYGRNIFDSISLVVDEIFADYLSRPNVKQPILTQYCDGNRVSCPNWMSQWGSKNLADQGYSTIQILRNYYGDNMYINTAEEISGIPSSWPGYDLTIGSSGNKVLQMQEQLNVIAEVYSSIPTVYENGYFDEETQDAVEAFQRLFGLPVSGIVDYPTWYKIQSIYVAVTRIAELQ